MKCATLPFSPPFTSYISISLTPLPTSLSNSLSPSLSLSTPLFTSTYSPNLYGFLSEFLLSIALFTSAYSLPHPLLPSLTLSCPPSPSLALPPPFSFACLFPHFTLSTYLPMFPCTYPPPCLPLPLHTSDPLFPSAPPIIPPALFLPLSSISSISVPDPLPLNLVVHTAQETVTA